VVGTARNGPSALVILDGASEPLGAAPTSLERARTPALDALVAEGELTRLRTVAPWLEPGSESAIPALLGWTPPAAVDRGLVEAAARELPIGPGERAWRLDVRAAGSGTRADAAAVVGALAAALPGHAVHAIGEHRLLVVGERPLPPVAPPSRDLALHRWPEGMVPPPLLDATTTVVGARGAAAGIARLMGAHVVVPSGASGRRGSDLAAKGRAAADALAAGARTVVVHVGAPDEAAHERDVAAKVAAIEQADRDVIAPLADAVRALGGSLAVCPDHGCDPASGLHDAAPVPRLDWNGGATSGPPAPIARRRLTERAVAELPATELATRELAAA
jgi:2,3-bisphosphoglycerate-independent phosphoglycerate mutase